MMLRSASGQRSTTPRANTVPLAVNSQRVRHSVRYVSRNAPSPLLCDCERNRTAANGRLRAKSCTTSSADRSTTLTAPTPSGPSRTARSFERATPIPTATTWTIPRARKTRIIFAFVRGRPGGGRAARVPRTCGGAVPSSPALGAGRPGEGRPRSAPEEHSAGPERREPARAGGRAGCRHAGGFWPWRAGRSTEATHVARARRRGAPTPGPSEVSRNRDFEDGPHLMHVRPPCGGSRGARAIGAAPRLPGRVPPLQGGFDADDRYRSVSRTLEVFCGPLAYAGGARSSRASRPADVESPGAPTRGHARRS